MNTHRSDNLGLATDAAEWVLRRIDDRSPECSADFLRWLKESPRHIDEFMLASTTYAALRGSNISRTLEIDSLLQTTPSNIVPLTTPGGENGDNSRDPAGTAADAVSVTTVCEPADPALPSQSSGYSAAKHQAPLVAVAAASAALAFGLWVLWTYLPGADSFATGVGEQRVVRLQDGSLLHLNTRSRVDVQFSGQSRELRLVRGEALFTVARDALRPFRVLTSNAVVQAIGTQFNVYERGDQTKVAVIEGQVRVTTRPDDRPAVPSVSEAGGSGSELPTADGDTAAPALLAVGEQADITRSRIVKSTIPDVSTAVAWRQRRLVFRAVPLVEVAQEFNRYNELQIRIESGALGQRLIWGVFLADEPQMLIKFLAQDDSLEIQSVKNRLIVRSR